MLPGPTFKVHFSSQYLKIVQSFLTYSRLEIFFLSGKNIGSGKTYILYK